MFSLQTMFGKTNKIYDLLESSADAALEVAQTVNHLAHANNEGSAAALAALSAARRRVKQIARHIDQELIKSFVTVLDREDIEAMSSGLYKVTKTVDNFSERYVLVAQRLAGVDFTERTDILASCAEVVSEMVHSLRRGLRIAPMRKLQDGLQALEAKADKLLLDPYRGLYLDTTDPMRAVLAKDLFETLEKAIDKCRDVGNVIYSIVLKNS
ncbi:MAG TPA: hypothetical protein VFQ88_00955 [Nevskiaceae bacterium]|nr:hypothetical protein [Nevskiaceae bacterium]